ncbi:hypothetical protein LTR84_011993 [Exophiala bonariae]|uniref:Methyltransferase domain-containing protein n=1 Tax=Exophiala bonariae TaxID=1690606 RepID=A0AAV9MUC6_9EURO|nr:hypothetical protein LTR84_011993 [Exophiala bonariae]
MSSLMIETSEDIPIEQTSVTQGAPLVPDSDASDTDSAIGESVAGSFYSASLASSVLNYTYENGRRYHAYREGNYLLPNDEKEQERLDMMHHICRMAIGGAIFRAPLHESLRVQRVLDMGCGTGLWTITFADDWPEAVVIGTDLSPIQPSWVPPNCKFYVDDIEREWTYPPAERFDYIHGRALLGSISDWRKLFSNAFNNLNPGGILEIQERPTDVQSDDGGKIHVPHMADWLDKLNDGLSAIGKPSRIIHLLKGYMEEAGFLDVREEIYKLPIGPWAKGRRNKELGLFFLAHCANSAEPYTLALFTRVLGYSAEEVHAILERVKIELRNPRAHLYIPLYFVWGRKPG